MNSFQTCFRGAQLYVLVLYDMCFTARLLAVFRLINHLEHVMQFLILILFIYYFLFICLSYLNIPTCACLASK